MDNIGATTPQIQTLNKFIMLKNLLHFILLFIYASNTRDPGFDDPDKLADMFSRSFDCLVLVLPAQDLPYISFMQVIMSPENK